MAVISETRIGAHGGGLVRIMDDCCRGLTEDERQRRVETQKREIARVWVRAKMREMEEIGNEEDHAGRTANGA